jgi:FtsZ-interacting cell division protein ZipA
MAPSKIVAGTPLCTWDPASASCSLTPPPSTASFLIIVSLLTLLLSVPLIILVHLLIDKYASRWPGSRGFEDDITKEMNKEKEKEEGEEEDTKRSKSKDAASTLWNSACKSEFGEVVKRSVPIEATAGVDAHVGQSQMAYAGKPTASLHLLHYLCSSFVMC